MTFAEFKAGRAALGLTGAELGRILDINSGTVRKYEMDPDTASTARRPNPTAARVMQWMLDGYRPPEWPARLSK